MRKRNIRYYLKNNQLKKDSSVVKLAKKYLEKAKINLITMSILYDLNKNSKARRELKIPKDYDSDEWIVVCGYYAMYTSALALLAKIGYKSKNHLATICALETFFLKKKLINKEDLEVLNSAIINKEELEELTSAKTKREIAQYSVTKSTTQLIAEKIKKDAYKFINKIEILFEKD